MENENDADENDNTNNSSELFKGRYYPNRKLSTPNGQRRNSLVKTR